MHFVIALLLAAVIGGGISFVAQNALPGEPLWSFKVGVSERIEDILAPDGNMQANFDIAKIKTRIEEATLLSAANKLNTITNAEVMLNINAHVKSVEAQVAALEAAGDYSTAADIVLRFQAALARGAAVLDLRSALDSASALSEKI